MIKYFRVHFESLRNAQRNYTIGYKYERFQTLWYDIKNRFFKLTLILYKKLGLTLLKMQERHA